MASKITMKKEQLKKLFDNFVEKVEDDKEIEIKKYDYIVASHSPYGVVMDQASAGTTLVIHIGANDSMLLTRMLEEQAETAKLAAPPSGLFIPGN